MGDEFDEGALESKVSAEIDDCFVVTTALNGAVVCSDSRAPARRDTMATNSTDTQVVTVLLVVLGALVVLPALFMGFGMMGAGPMGTGPMNGAGHGGMWGSGGSVPGWWPLAGLLLQLAFLAAVVGLGYLLYRAVTGIGDRTATEDPAVEELRLAYARGDLDEDEYERRRDQLQRDS